MPTTILNQDAVRRALDDLAGTGALYDGAKVMLWTNAPPFVPTKLTPFSTLTPPVTAGIAALQTAVWKAAYIGADQDVHLTAPSLIFATTAVPASAETAYGSAVVGGVSPNQFIISIEVFDQPVTFIDKFDGVTVDVDVPFLG